MMTERASRPLVVSYTIIIAPLVLSVVSSILRGTNLVLRTIAQTTMIMNEMNGTVSFFHFHVKEMKVRITPESRASESR